MEDLATEGARLLFERGGVLGVAVAALSWICWRLFSKYEAVQEKRIAESREMVTAINESTSAIETLTKLVEAGRTSK